MAQFVEAVIDIDGKTIKQISSFSLSQSVSEHHSFRLVCPTEGIDGSKGKIFQSSREWIGGSINVKIDAIGSKGSFKFSGVITQIESSRSTGHMGDVIISGYAPTVLMDQGPHCQSWEKKNLKRIAQDLVQNVPKNVMDSKIAPSYGETISYTVQYKETAWQFLNRLSATYGEWLMYDGQKLLFGQPEGAKVDLVYGNSLTSFDLAMQVRPSKFQVMAYDYLNTEVYDGSPSGVASKAGLSDLGKHALSKSEQFYGTQPKLWNNQFLNTKKQLDDYVTTKAVMQSSNMVKFQGNSGNPTVQLGGVVSVKGKNVYNDADESFGDYLVISVNHYYDGLGHYHNDFIAVPATLKMPPLGPAVEPRCETQSAVVTDNNDSAGLGRIRAKFHWMAGDEKTPWMRITSPHGGDSKGMFFIPEVGEEVIVGFEGDSPTKPFVLGTVYNSKGKTSFANDKNDIKALQTRSGNLLVMDDKEGSVHVADAKGNDIKIDGDGNIKITSSDSITLTCGDAKIEMKKDGTINIKGKEITIDATDKATMKSGQASFKADGQQGNADMAGMKSTVTGTQEADVKGLKTVISADTEVDITANAQISMKAGAMVEVKGAIINLN